MERKRMHPAVGLVFLKEALLRQGERQNLVERDGKPVTLKEALATIEEARAKGYEVYPPCDSVDAKGRCTGHPLD